MGRLDSRVERVALNLEGLLKLLGGTPDERERFWEIVRGITTPVQYKLVNAALTSVQTELKSAHDVLASVHNVAPQISKERAIG